MVDLKREEMLSELLKNSTVSTNPSAKGLLAVIEDGIRLQEERCVLLSTIAKGH